MTNDHESREKFIGETGLSKQFTKRFFEFALNAEMSVRAT
jgi:hypothetical protein